MLFLKNGFDKIPKSEFNILDSSSLPTQSTLSPYHQPDGYFYRHVDVCEDELMQRVEYDMDEQGLFCSIMLDIMSSRALKF